MKIPDQRAMWEAKYQDGANEELRGKASDFATSFARKYITPNARILDIACGNGRDSQFFASKGAHVVAIDVSQSIIDRNIELYGSTVDYRQFDISHEDWNSLGSNFDVVFSFLGLHYFNDQDTHRVFNTIHKHLKSNGVFAFACKANDPTRQVSDTEVEPGLFVNNGHVRHYFSEPYVKGLLFGRFDIEILRTVVTQYNRTTDVVECIAIKKPEE